ncbi:hypothetical protein ACFFX0_29025 [Citricoccus parietis]|uniref:Uncharacterized protein n=1 Tax=Citricoccus parietis TaxID=592307 RepID=A0ABV5G7U4_9MICC
MRRPPGRTGGSAPGPRPCHRRRSRSTPERSRSTRPGPPSSGSCRGWRPAHRPFRPPRLMRTVRTWRAPSNGGPPS